MVVPVIKNEEPAAILNVKYFPYVSLTHTPCYFLYRKYKSHKMQKGSHLDPFV